MRVRNAVQEDLSRLIGLHSGMDKEERALGCTVLHPATPEYIREKLADPATTFLVMEHDGIVVAFAYGTRKGNVLELQNVFVAPLWRRYGVARELLSRLFVTTAATRARAFVLKGNIYHSFWTSLGFRPVRALVNAFQVERDLGALSRDVRKQGCEKLRLVG